MEHTHTHTHTGTVDAMCSILTVGQDLREDVAPGNAGEAAHQPAAGELLPALRRLQRVAVHWPACNCAMGQWVDTLSLTGRTGVLTSCDTW